MTDARDSGNAPANDASDDAVGDGKKKYWLDDPKNIRRVIVMLFACCAIVLALDVVFMLDGVVEDRHQAFEHGKLEAEGWFGFYGLYGFVACVLLVLAAKQMRKFLMRDEDYYDG